MRFNLVVSTATYQDQSGKVCGVFPHARKYVCTRCKEAVPPGEMRLHAVLISSVRVNNSKYGVLSDSQPT